MTGVYKEIRRGEAGVHNTSLEGKNTGALINKDANESRTVAAHCLSNILPK